MHVSLHSKIATLRFVVGIRCCCCIPEDIVNFLKEAYIEDSFPRSIVLLILICSIREPMSPYTSSAFLSLPHSFSGSIHATPLLSKGYLPYCIGISPTVSSPTSSWALSQLPLLSRLVRENLRTPGGQTPNESVWTHIFCSPQRLGIIIGITEGITTHFTTCQRALF